MITDASSKKLYVVVEQTRPHLSPVMVPTNKPMMQELATQLFKVRVAKMHTPKLQSI